MKKFIQSRSAWEIIMVSLLAFFATVGVVLATTTIGTNITTEGNLAFATASSTGQVKFSDITSTSAGISFNSKNFTSVGNIAFATASSTGQVKFSDITTTSAGITFNSKNLTSVGDIAFATASSTGEVKFHSISSDRGYVKFTSAIDVNGLATTTAQGIVTPVSTSTTPTAYCDATTAGGLLWQTATKRLCVCTGSAWVLATTTGTCQ